MAAERSRNSLIGSIAVCILLVVAVVVMAVMSSRGPSGNKPVAPPREVDTTAWQAYQLAGKLLVKAEDCRELVGEMRRESAEDNEDVFDAQGRRAKVQYVGVPDKTCGENDDPAAHKAVFELKVEKGGTYYPWVRVWLLDGCGDSIIVTLQREGDAEPLRMQVEEETHERWLWRPLAGPAGVELREGTYKVVVENREDGARLSRILFVTRDYQSYMPTKPEG